MFSLSLSLRRRQLQSWNHTFFPSSPLSLSSQQNHQVRRKAWLVDASITCSLCRGGPACRGRNRSSGSDGTCRGELEGDRLLDLLVHRGAFSFFCDRMRPRQARLVLFFPRFLLEIEECDHFMPCGGWRVAQTRARGRIRNAKECERGRNGERRRSTDGACGRFFLSF